MTKIRVTIMTENDKHFDERYSDEQIEIAAKEAWNKVIDLLSNPLFGDDRGIVEKCELIER